MWVLAYVCTVECAVVVINNFYRWFSFISANTIMFRCFAFFFSLVLLLQFFLYLIVAIVVASLVMLLWIFKKKMQIAHNKNRYECWCFIDTLNCILYRLKHTHTSIDIDTTREVNETRPFRMVTESIECTHRHSHSHSYTTLIITNTFSSMSRQRREMYVSATTTSPYTKQNLCDSLLQQQQQQQHQANANKRRITWNYINSLSCCSILLLLLLFFFYLKLTSYFIFIWSFMCVSSPLLLLFLRVPWMSISCNDLFYAQYKSIWLTAYDARKLNALYKYKYIHVWHICMNWYFRWKRQGQSDWNKDTVNSCALAISHYVKH